MSSFRLLAALLAVLVRTSTFALDEDFAFDISGDFEVEIDGGSRRLWTNKEVTAQIGKAFHLIIPKEAFGRDAPSYEVKQHDGAPLPTWLLFDKIGGIFWGVPLVENVGTLKLVIRTTDTDKSNSEELQIHVVNMKTNDPKSASDKCPTNEDNTILTLLIDKGVQAIKPKQRVIAINNIAKFFGLPFSAFTMKSQLEKDDITDSSVVLAGPGNLRSRSSKDTSLLQLLVGCDGRLWLKTAPLIHQLKQQARDGTIAEVLGLPLIGWRVRTETRPVIRNKREVDDYGSGNYDDDYYDNYDEDDYNDFDSSTTPKVVPPPPTNTKSTTTTTTTEASTSASQSQTHPHRHHHGVHKSPDDLEGISGRDHHHQSSRVNLENNPATLPMTPTSTSTTTSTTTTTTIKPTEPELTSSVAKSATQPDLILPDKATTPSDYDYETYDDDDYDTEEEPVESQTIVPDVTQPRISETQFESEATSTLRTTIKDSVAETIPPTTTEELIVEDSESPTVVITDPHIQPTPSTTTTVTSTTTTTTESPIPDTTVELFTTTTTTEASTIPFSPSTTPTTTASTTTATTTTTTTTTTTPIPDIIPTIPDFTTVTEEVETTTPRVTTVRHVYSTPRTTTVREVTEFIENEQKNFPPYIENRLPQKVVIAGKILRYVLPKNTFKDMEDGYDLTLEFLNAQDEPVGKDSWCHFNPITREIYGLPLEEDVSKWEYVLKATDSEGKSVKDRFTITVQQHKSYRVVNHEFSLVMRIEKKDEFSNYIDWSLKTLRVLGRIYHANITELTVRHVNYTSDPVIFTWTNDSIPTNYCPTHTIEDLYKVLTANDRGDPSQELNRLLWPELRVKRVENRSLGVCETHQVPVTPPTNFPPFLRNPVDQINATVGELLIFKVPEDTFYDPEDTDSRTLNISLVTGDRQPIPAHSWLQFDSKNREFYGIPTRVERKEYQLVCVDSVGLPATDSLVVKVDKAVDMPYNVEFVMTLLVPYETFAHSATLQRKFVEKLLRAFGDRNASNIHFAPFKKHHDSIVISWFNKSLSTERCPKEDIERLKAVMVKDKEVSPLISSYEFPISKIEVRDLGNCKSRAVVAPPSVRPKHEDRIPIDRDPEPSSDEFQHLMTYVVPAIIIAVMLFLAAIAACVLYRRRRTGKMNVEEDGRQNKKGIPVIFQEELEEKPEPGTKTPVILKDEKPPLAPPEYSKSGSLKLTDDSEPYQPPPPFTRAQDNGRQPRPKPTPTYRKPPPYVPP